MPHGTLHNVRVLKHTNERKHTCTGTRAHRRTRHAQARAHTPAAQQLLFDYTVPAPTHGGKCTQVPCTTCASSNTQMDTYTYAHEHTHTDKHATHRHAHTPAAQQLGLIPPVNTHTSELNSQEQSAKRRGQLEVGRTSQQHPVSRVTWIFFFFRFFSFPCSSIAAGSALKTRSDSGGLGTISTEACFSCAHSGEMKQRFPQVSGSKCIGDNLLMLSQA